MPELLDDEMIAGWVETHSWGPRKERTDGRVSGLMIRTGPGGATWSVVMRDRFGRKIRTALGDWPAVSTQDARQQAIQLKSSTRLDALAPQNDSDLGPVLLAYKAARLSRQKTGESAFAILSRLLAPFWNRPLVAIRTNDLRVVLAPERLRAPSQADRAVTFLRAFFGWAMDGAYIPSNPALGLGRRAPRPRRPAHILSIEDLHLLWDGCCLIGFPYGHILRLVMSTGESRAEIARMHERDLSLWKTGQASVWQFPEQGGAREVWLSPAAGQILDEALARRAYLSPEYLVFNTNAGAGLAPPMKWAQAQLRLERALAKAGIALQAFAWEIDDLEVSVNHYLSRIALSGPGFYARAGDRSAWVLKAWMSQFMQTGARRAAAPSVAMTLGAMLATPDLELLAREFERSTGAPPSRKERPDDLLSLFESLFQNHR